MPVRVEVVMPMARHILLMEVREIRNTVLRVRLTALACRDWGKSTIEVPFGVCGVYPRLAAKFWLIG